MRNELYLEGKNISSVFIANTFLSRFCGYMLRKKPHHEAIFITPCNSIHTFFMRFDIDVVFVDKDLCVLEKLEALKPRKIIMPIRGAVAVIETTAGGFQSCKIGSKFSVKNVE